MTAIVLPFLDRFREPLLSGTKTCTSRRVRLAKEGDEFLAFGVWFKVVSVEQAALGYVASILFKEEGVDSPADFIEVWRQLHPSNGFKPHQIVWLHRFERIPRDEVL